MNGNIPVDKRYLVISIAYIEHLFLFLQSRFITITKFSDLFPETLHIYEKRLHISHILQTFFALFSHLFKKRRREPGDLFKLVG